MEDDEVRAGQLYVTTGENTSATPLHRNPDHRRRARRLPVEAGPLSPRRSACLPWANRTLIVRRLLGLGTRSRWACAARPDADSWTFDLDPGGVDPVLGIPRLKDAYEKRFPGYPKGITVPAMVDTRDGAVVTNDFAQMTLDFSTSGRSTSATRLRPLYPEHLRDEIDELNAMVFTEVNNGVYRCGFAGSQTPTTGLRPPLRRPRPVGGSPYRSSLPRRRHHHLRPTFGSSPRWRFDPVYHGHFKANRNLLAQMPAL